MWFPRRQLLKFGLRFCIVLAFVAVLLLMVHFFLQDGPDDNARETSVERSGRDQANAPKPHPTTNKLVPSFVQPPPNLTDVFEKNRRETIRNLDRFRIRLDTDGVVFLVQVHNRLDELAYLIRALQEVRYIGESLIVFSHDLDREDINTLVSTIDFAPVLQLFYPYSIQLNPTVFPGNSPKDCKWNMTRDEAKNAHCTNRLHPDSYGHYRDGVFTQLKHHWLWKIEYAMNEIRALKDFQGTFLRLDEDYYLLPDIIHVIRQANRLQESQCPECLMGILGEREEWSNSAFDFASNLLRTHRWYPDIGRGMSFGRKFWNEFKRCSREFCQFDDYNWDISLQHMTAVCLAPGMKAWRPVAGRVFHLGMCKGFHRNQPNCNVTTVFERVKSLLKNKSQYFFPDTMSMMNVIGKEFTKDPHNYGGWGDIRDHEFCLSLFETTSRQRTVLQTIQENS